MNMLYTIDIQGFSDDIGLPLETIASLYEDFACDINICAAELKTLLKKNDWESMLRILHNIKGLSSNFRLLDIYEECNKLYSLIKKEDYDNISLLTDNFLSIIELTVSGIILYFQEQGYSLVLDRQI